MPQIEPFLLLLVNKNVNFLRSIKVSETNSEVILTCGQNKAVIHASPFTIDFYRNDVLYVTANSKGLFKFEHYRTKPVKEWVFYQFFDSLQMFDVFNWMYVLLQLWRAPPENGDENQINEAPEDDVDEPGAWEEDFKSHHDSKPHGPEAVAMDFSFPQAQVLFGMRPFWQFSIFFSCFCFVLVVQLIIKLFVIMKSEGIPEHADSFALKSTLSSEPYRLYNLDVFEYELDNGMALYGSIPVIYGHG